jgi:RNA polymerase sigma-70 factor, ECF subfamily
MSLPLASLLSRLFRRRSPLAQAARDGDADAIGALYDQHVDGLYAFVFYRVGRDPDVACDVVQATFARALDHADEFDPARGSFGAWLTTLSRNVMRDQLRAHRQSDAVAERWDRIDASLAQLYDALEQSPLPGDVLARAETRDLVHMTIANLPASYRTALTGKYVDGKSLDDLARELDLSVDAVKSLLARARRAFKETFTTLGHALSEVSP